MPKIVENQFQSVPTATMNSHEEQQQEYGEEPIEELQLYSNSSSTAVIPRDGVGYEFVHDGHRVSNRSNRQGAIMSRLSDKFWLIGLLIVIASLVAMIVFFGPSYYYDSSESEHTDGLLFSSFDLQYAPLPTHVKKIAFGSCNSQHYPDQPHWETLMYGPFQPDLLLLMGDNVYGRCDDTDCTALIDAYRDLASHSSFQSLIKSIPIMATLDDGDYGMNDADRHNPYKDTAISLFKEFFHIRDDDLQNNGVYSSHTFLMDEDDDESILQIIVLDTRYQRDTFLYTDEPMAPHKEAYMPDYNDTEKTMLGDDQWLWLKQKFNQPAALRIVLSSIQVVADGNGFECWRMLPLERERLYSLLSDPPGGGEAIVVSGDHHVGGIYQLYSPEEEPDTLFDITASSWTHTIPLGAFGSNCTTSEECDEVDPTRLDNLVRTNHFGSIEVEWKKRRATLSIRRTETSPGYYHPQKFSDAGTVLQNIIIDL